MRRENRVSVIEPIDVSDVTEPADLAALLVAVASTPEFAATLAAHEEIVDGLRTQVWPVIIAEDDDDPAEDDDTPEPPPPHPGLPESTPTPDPEPDEE